MRSVLIDPPRPAMSDFYVSANGDGVLRFGRERVPIRRIASYHVSDHETWPVIGLALVAGMFLFLASCLAAAVASGDSLPPRWLIGASFLAFLGLAGFSELPTIRRQRVVRLSMVLDDGSVCSFASADPRDVDVLVRQITGRA